jgi:hypothetical protein
MLVLLAFCRRDVAGGLHLDPRPVCSHLGLSCPLSEDDRKGLQKRVLNSGWLTIGMLTLAMGEMQEAYLQENWIDAGFKTLPPFREAFENRWLDCENVLDRTLELYGVDRYGAARSLIMRDPFYMELNGIEELDGDLYDSFSNLEVDFIPDKLLDLPITDSKLRFLHFLWRSQSGAIKWEVAHSKPVMEQAVQHAISTGKLELTCLLIDLRLRGTSSAVSAEDFLAAAKYNHIHILQILIEFDSRDFPRRDPDLKQWVRSAKDRGDKFGSMLLAYMQASVIKPDRYSFADFQDARSHCGSLLSHKFPMNRARNVINRLGERYEIQPGRWMWG